MLVIDERVKRHELFPESSGRSAGVIPEPPDEPAIYHIRLRGHIDTRRSAWFDHLVITLDEDGTTLLAGSIVDQAALHGVLTRIRDLGLLLISVSRIEDDEALLQRKDAQ
jgi:hypothetical protein